MQIASLQVSFDSCDFFDISSDKKGLYFLLKGKNKNKA